MSGFHALISSGTTPKLLAKERHAIGVGYGSMLLESLVAMMALIAAASLDPGVYFAVNSPAGVVGSTPAAAVAKISSWGFPVTVEQMHALAVQAGEPTLFYRTGGAPSLALGMAKIFTGAQWAQGLVGFWYHFAIMFEALFILTVLDAGTRVGRFMLQDLLGHAWPKLRIGGVEAGDVLGTSACIVGAWGWFLYQGVRDPLGGVNSLWPLFGISNQLLATVALCVGTTVLMKMHGARFLWVTCVPLAWLTAATFTAGWQKLFATAPALGFLAHANMLEAGVHTASTAALVFTDRLDAAVTATFLVMVSAILVDSLRVWTGLLGGTRKPASTETPFVASVLAEEA